ncbi:hypothetical protein [Conexibacter woesei]|uniref:hypothetical protein n=1 Tax=Conexibacter woesei TaxID=191495 RepID=UPI0012DE8758|nr:hypothetical protein [Conexibacter woesei]
MNQTVHIDPRPAADRSSAWVAAAADLAIAAAAVSNFCDHLEHCEANERADVAQAARTLRNLALVLAEVEGVNLIELYGARLNAIERRHPMNPVDGFIGGERVRDAGTWDDLQEIQWNHDRLYHPDVVGLAKFEQARHCALHLAKLAGAAATATRDPDQRPDFIDRRLPDTLLFGLKLATLFGERLPAVPLALDQAPISADRTA